MSGEQLQRTQIMVPAAQKARIRALAGRLDCSISEVYRRAAEAYARDLNDSEIQHPELEALVEALQAGIGRANIAIDRAEREVRATLDFYRARAKSRRHRKARP
ncbi:MAG: hypothetical protein ACR2RB_08660 [Gammaproteobacteria bacterium]